MLCGQGFDVSFGLLPQDTYQVLIHKELSTIPYHDRSFTTKLTATSAAPEKSQQLQLEGVYFEPLYADTCQIALEPIQIGATSTISFACSSALSGMTSVQLKRIHDKLVIVSPHWQRVSHSGDYSTCKAGVSSGHRAGRPSSVDQQEDGKPC